MRCAINCARPGIYNVMHRCCVQKSRAHLCAIHFQRDAVAYLERINARCDVQLINFGTLLKARTIMRKSAVYRARRGRVVPRHSARRIWFIALLRRPAWRARGNERHRSLSTRKVSRKIERIFWSQIMRARNKRSKRVKARRAISSSFGIYGWYQSVYCQLNI